MKRSLLIIFVLILCLSIIGCLPSVSKTDQAENHKYEKNETIRILSKDNNEELGTLVITKVEILLDEAFEAQVEDGRDENGKIKYKSINYSQVIQIFYDAKLDVSISYSNFLVSDSLFETATDIDYIDPKPDVESQRKKIKTVLLLA